MKNDSKNKRLIVLMSVVTGLFLIIVFYLVYFEIFKAEKLNEDIRNARNFFDDSKIDRGSIFDKNGKLLAESKEIDGEFLRKYSYDYIYSNIIGYSNSKLGKSNIEASYNQELLNITDNSDIFTKLDNLVNDSETSDIYLTIEDEIENYAWHALGERFGSVFITKPKTGEIVAMVSKPSFDVNNILNVWENVIKSQDGNLLNRITQGQYEPGSIFKVLTSIVFLRSNINLDYFDSGTATIADYTVQNYASHEYGQMDLERALNVSSNTYFFEKSQLVSNKMFTDTLKDFGIGKEINFPINKTDSKFQFRNNLSDLEKGNSAYGQGENYVTPFDMMLIAMGIANDGVVYQPYIVDRINRNGISQLTKPTILASSIEPEYASLVRSYLKSTAEYNGYKLNNNISFAGKTGTAESSENNIAWYMGMAPAEDPEYAIIVNIENTTQLASKTAAPLAVDIMNHLYETLE